MFSIYDFIHFSNRILDYDFGPFLTSANSVFGYIGLGTIIGLITFLKTKPQANQKTTKDYFHFTQKKRFTEFEIDLRFANNPIIKKFRLFSYDGPEGEYDVGGLLVPVPKNIFEKRKKDEVNEVWVHEKSILRHNRTVKLNIQIERPELNYSENIDHEFLEHGIVVKNKNKIPVKFYKIHLPSEILQKTSLDVLRSRPMVDDAYPEKGENYLELTEVSGRKIRDSENVLIRF